MPQFEGPQRYGQNGLGEFRRFAFILIEDYASQGEAISWGLLFLEWAGIALGVGLVFYLANPRANMYHQVEIPKINEA